MSTAIAAFEGTDPRRQFSVPEKNQQFCRNPYNLTGLCNRKDCPLANSRYATVREHEGAPSLLAPLTVVAPLNPCISLGVLYLYTKTIERAHLPSKMWERIPLPNSYTKALELVSLFRKSQTQRTDPSLRKRSIKNYYTGPTT